MAPLTWQNSPFELSARAASTKVASVTSAPDVGRLMAPASILRLARRSQLSLAPDVAATAGIVPALLQTNAAPRTAADVHWVKALVVTMFLLPCFDGRDRVPLICCVPRRRGPRP